VDGADVGSAQQQGRAADCACHGANLAVNLAFFLSHPVFTPYYTIPMAMLSQWSLLFAFLMHPPEAVDGGLLAQAAKA
jgi:hypothetical protein